MKPQNQAVARWLIQHGSITPLEALKSLGIQRLGARIYELRTQHGAKIVKKMTKVRTRAGYTHVARYSVQQ